MMPGFHLTGRHVAAIFVAFFAVVIAVNVLMASYAVGGFGGTVVDNSYVASQRFNGWLAQARRFRMLLHMQTNGCRGHHRLTRVKRQRLLNTRTCAAC